MLVGDDVVDLGDPETRDGATHPRFDARVFAPDELSRIHAHPQPRVLRWTLWAAKESAFKLIRKLAPREVFSPLALLVLGGAPGEEGGLRVVAGALLVRVQVARHGDCLHALALRGAESATVVRWVPPPDAGVTLTGADASLAVRQLALTALTPHFGSDRGELQIRKRDRVPCLVRGRLPLSADLSLSHHGRFVGFACALSQDRGDPRVMWSAAALGG